MDDHLFDDLAALASQADIGKPTRAYLNIEEAHQITACVITVETLFVRVHELEQGPLKERGREPT